MKSITITLLSDKAIRTYNEIEELGSKRRFVDKQMAKRVYKEEVLSNNPFIIKITPNIGWLASRVNGIINLEQQIKKGFSDKQLKENIDYKLEVE